MIERWRITNGVNDYATITDPEEHEDERKQLEQEGYVLSSRYVKDGRREELWYK